MVHNSEGQLNTKAWFKITSDSYILQAVTGYRLEFSVDPPVQTRIPFPYKLQNDEKEAVNMEVQRLLLKGVLEKAYPEDGQFISNIFTRPKKSGGFRMILDLSELNEYIKYNHFKMDTFDTALTLVTEHCFMSSVDLRDAYYHVPIAKDHRKYLRFFWNNQLLQFCVLPNGLTSGPRVFTKILKPPFAKIRQQGHCIMGYIDDTFIVGKSFEAAQAASNVTTQTLTELGFTIHPDKSVFIPTQEIEFLGFIINSESMTVTLPSNKKDEIQSLCQELISAHQPSIRQVAAVIGKLVAALPAVKYGALYYRELEKEKIRALKQNHGHFDRKITLSNRAISDLQWWCDNIHQAYQSIDKGKTVMVIDTDASGLGWGASDTKTHIGGRWNQEELERARCNEINYLEMEAVYLALKSYCKHMKDIHIRLRVDNMTAVTYLNNMGGVKSTSCNEMAKKIWHWCIHRNIWISVEHLPGILNVIADFKSRNFNEGTEWQLNKDVFYSICQHFGSPQIDIFASRLNAQLPRYVAWKPDPDADSVDAFMMDWGSIYFYAFPPFCLIGKCLRKIEQEHATGIMIVPKWPTQPWFPKMLHLLIDDPVLLPPVHDLLTQPVSGIIHPLSKKLYLMACRLSGDHLKIWDYQTGLSTFSWHHGEHPQGNNTTPILADGWSFAANEKLIRCVPLSQKY